MCLDLGAVTILHPRFEILEASREKGREKHLGGNTSNSEQASVLVHIEWYPANRVRLKEARPQVVDEPQRCGD